MDLIAAVSTAPAVSAIGIVRLSGEGCLTACDRVFRPAAGEPLSRRPARTMVFGDLLDQRGAVIDQGLAVRFSEQHSYTGEVSAELHCHGSPVVERDLLSALFAAGARQAKAGEFTRRAFLNGRMDLTEAEAVIDLIDAETAAAARNAAAQLKGGLRRELEQVQQALLDVTSRFYAVVDYPDEDIEDVRPDQIAAALERSDQALERLLATCQRGKILKSGVRTAIVGLPNAGKSSLLNALAGYERAIVTPVPGTTRDTVEETVLCGGVALRLTDTAGIRKTADAVEALGVERAVAALEDAALALCVVDGSVPFSAEALTLVRRAAEKEHWILVWAKADLPAAGAPQFDWAAEPGLHPPAAAVAVSAATGQGLAALESAVAALYPAGDHTGDGALLTDARQEDAVRRAQTAVRRAADALESGMTPDAVLTDAEEALSALGELTGRTAREDIVDAIFSRFCVGK